MKLYILFLQLILIFNSVHSDLDFDIYHNTETIDLKMKNLIENCRQGNIKEIMSNGPNNLLKYYDITNENNNMNFTKQNIFLLSGEHPRELITTEFLFNFVIYLCENDKESLLNYFNFRIILNANPEGRKLVEKGLFCKRTNLNNVDINRNWDIFWEAGINNGIEENPGMYPFSENETKFIFSSIKDFNPKVFLTIHSGVYGLYLPYAYLETEGIYNYKNMKKVLSSIKDSFCSVCGVGAPSKLIGYKSTGTCLDYVYDKLKVPYSLAWEIYSGENNFPKLESYLLEHKNNSQSSFLLKKANEFMKYTSSIGGSSNLRKNKNYSSNQNKQCLKLFNPSSKLEYQFVVINWTNALIYLLEYVKFN